MTLRRLFARLHNAVRPGQRDDDLAREIASHLALLEDEFRRRGLAEADARMAARRSLGSAALTMDRHRDARSFIWLDDLQRDVRYALRSLKRTPGFTALGVLTLALGIGATAAIFTLVNDVLLRPLPVRDPAALVVLGDARGSGTAIGRQGGSFTLFSYDLYRRLRDARVFDALCAVQSSKSRVIIRRAGVSGDDTAYARLVSTNYFAVLGTNAAAGRLLGAADDAASATPAAVVSYRYWSDRLNRDPAVVGSVLRVDRVAATVVGVAAEGFFGETLEPDPPSVWMPLAMERELDPSRSVIDAPDIHWLYLIGRLAPPASMALAQDRATATLQDWLRERRGADVSDETRANIAHTHIELRSGQAGITHARRDYGSALRMLLAISGVVLLIACANIANLLLARGAARESERAIRLAIGASRGRLVRQLLAESLTLALAGGAAGLLVASWGVQLLLAVVFRGAASVPFSTTPDARVLAFTLVVSCAAALVFGALPAISGSVAVVVRDRRGVRWGRALIASQVALSIVVLAAAGALARSLGNLAAQAYGFDSDRVLVVDIDPARAGYTLARLPPLYRALRERLGEVPGVTRASLSYYSPFDACCWAFTISVPGRTPPADEHRSALLNRVSAGYFETLGTRVLRGRTFDERDTPSAPRVAIVNLAFARRFLGGGDPIGVRFSIGDGGGPGALEIVGQVENAKYDGPRDDADPMAFLPLLQGGDETDVDAIESQFIRTIEVRAAGDPVLVAGAVRRALAEIDPDLPVLAVSKLSTQVGQAINGEQALARLAGFFAVVALALTCVGAYGLTAYSVQRRTREIGIRVALGARRGAVVGMVIRDVLTRAGLGALLGVPAAFVVLRAIQSALYGVGPADLTDASAAAVVLFASMVAAGYVPARAASRIEPVQALRHE